jgi:death on curing protein
MLQSAIARSQASFEGHDLYPDIYSKAAALFDSLTNNHPFIDGNKRTAITATALFMRYNGYRLTASNDDVVTLMMQVAQGLITLEVITNWLLKNNTEI